MEYVMLPGDIRMPMLGYGVYQISREECERCVREALEVGYRLIDTAQSYFNEEEVGAAIAGSGIPREQIFLTTKVWLEHYGYDACRDSVLDSLRKLRTDYLDLCLLHQPFSDVYGAYRALEDLRDEGRIRAIGISNFYPDRVVDIAQFARVRPAVNQIELHPHHQQQAALDWHRKYGIQTEAWAPFGEGRGGLFELPELVRIGDRYGKTPAQVMLRWHLQRGVVAIPKSTHRARMEENFQIFDFSLTEQDMQAIAALDQGRSSFFSHTDPHMVEWFAQMVEERRNKQSKTNKKREG